MLIPMYFLIGIWGHERRVYAAIKFVLFHHGRLGLDAHRNHLPLQRHGHV